MAAGKIIIRADGSQFQSEVKKSSSELNVMKGKLRELENQTKATYKEMRLQAQASGASTEELQKLQRKYFADQIAFKATRAELVAEEQANGRKMVKSEEERAQAADRTAEALRRKRLETEKLLRIPVREEHLEPTDRQKAGALVRGGGLRSAEAFAATIPGFAGFASAIFPLVGGAALVADLSTKVGELREKAREAREAGARIREGFEGINAPIETSVDTLRKQNAELDISIAKLMHKPENGLKLAVAEAALEVDHLADRARSAYDVVRKLLQEQKVGLLGTFTGQGSTTEAANITEGGFRDINNLSRDYKNAVRAYGADSDAAKQAKNALQERRTKLRGELATLNEKINGYEDVVTGGASGFGGVQTITRAKYEQVHGDQTAQRNIIGGALDVLNNQDDEDAARKEDNIKSRQLKQIELQKANSAASLAAQRKAQEDQRKQWEDELAAMQKNGKLTDSELHNLWVQRFNNTRADTENHRMAEKESFATLKTLNDEKTRLLDEGIKLREIVGRDGLKDVLGVALPGITANQKAAGEASKTLQSLREQQEAAKISIAEANVQYGLQAGRISRSDALVQLQTLHTLQYEGALKRLQLQRDAIQDGPGADAKRNVLDAQILDLNTRRTMQVMQDEADAAGATWSGALKRANAMWVQDSQDSARQVVDIYRQGLDGLNNDLSNVLQHVGERGHQHLGRELGNAVGGTLRGIGGTLTNVGLQRVESLALGKFGLNKPDGSKQNPWSVYVVNALDGKGVGSLIPSPATLNGIVGKASDDGLMQGIGGVAASTALSLLPGGALVSGLFGGFRALGGGVDEGKSYVVGERGPEFFTPAQSGYVTPNDRMGAMFGRGDNHFAIDARGSHDPAATEAAVQRGIARAAPHIVAASVKANKEQAARRPTGSGR